ncbi:trypsin-like serine protease [Cellulomonas cellasea]|uniref:Peptidase S1 domain-containing protein n=2 Tax=Cellulomonas cellasea TaxID=43670 RepID=A0A0A0B5U1_9CELL|nr:trypsin-like serine protease [Cellulomonas cellasea]KGM01189.1 hypothetical protein Q760_03045 [Cellulomonas cellasea DSM 20118]GEA87712.1 hypothetical protein CCE01nite_16610 [Cellulomonas cellasea]
MARRSWVVRTLAGALALTAGVVPAASAVQGSAPTGAAAAATVKIAVGEVRACSGALVGPSWVVTAKSCFAATPGAAVAQGAPTERTTATVGRTDLTSTAGHEVAVTLVVPHPDRDLVLVRLAAPVTDVAPVAVATTGPVPGEDLTVTGYGRTTTQWVPDVAHAATYTVTTVNPGTVDLRAASPDASVCKGDAGGPTLRTTPAGGVELVAIHHTADQGGCLGASTSGQAARDTRVDDLRDWITRSTTPTQQVALGGSRIAVLTDDRRAQVKDGGLRADWVQLLGANAKQVVVDGTRIAVLAEDGVAWVKDGATTATFVPVFTNVREIALSGNRIGVLTRGGEARVKEGDLYAPWVVEATGVTSLVLSGNRIGVVNDGGEAHVKEGSLSADWVVVYPGVKSLVMSGNRIGVLTKSGEVRVKEGGLRADWVVQSSGVTSLSLSGNRIGILKNGQAHVKEGPLGATWVLEASGVTSLVLSGNRIGVVDQAGKAHVKEGDLYAGWVVVWQ